MKGASGSSPKAISSAARPSRPATATSERMRCGRNSRSASRKAASVSTRRCVHRTPPLTSRLAASSASAGASSAISTRRPCSKRASPTGSRRTGHRSLRTRISSIDCSSIHTRSGLNQSSRAEPPAAPQRRAVRLVPAQLPVVLSKEILSSEQGLFHPGRQKSKKRWDGGRTAAP